MEVFLRLAMLTAIALGCDRGLAQNTATLPEIPPESSQPTRLLLLSDGGVLSGQITRDGDSYVVSRAGSQLRVPTARVMVECGSLDEAYLYRRQRIIRPTAEAHLALADWCLRFQLADAARRELDDATSIDPHHPRLTLLRMRLESSERTASRLSNSRPQPVRPAPAPSAADTALPAKVDVGRVPARVVERFTRKVQPVLVNNCTTAGCHQAGGSEAFQLDRALLHGLANRRTTMANLAAALALVDTTQPQQSPLLTVPRRAHGGLSDPVFGPRQEQAFKHLVEWVALVAMADGKAPAPANGQPADPTDAVQQASAEADMIESLADAGPVDAADAELPLGEDPSVALLAPRVRFGAQLTPWQPKDEFDPEIFNRRQRKRELSDVSDPSPLMPDDR